MYGFQVWLSHVYTVNWILFTPNWQEIKSCISHFILSPVFSWKSLSSANSKIPFGYLRKSCWFHMRIRPWNNQWFLPLVEPGCLSKVVLNYICQIVFGSDCPGSISEGFLIWISLLWWDHLQLFCRFSQETAPNEKGKTGAECRSSSFLRLPAKSWYCGTLVCCYDSGKVPSVSDREKELQRLRVCV